MGAGIIDWTYDGTNRDNNECQTATDKLSVPAVYGGGVNDAAYPKGCFAIKMPHKGILLVQMNKHPTGSDGSCAKEQYGHYCRQICTGTPNTRSWD